MATHEPEGGRLRARPGRLRSAVAWYRAELLAGLALAALTSCTAHILILGPRGAGGILATAVVGVAASVAIEAA